MMNKIEKQLLLNQLKIMAVLQRLDIKVHQEEAIKDLSEEIKNTQKILLEDLEKDLFKEEI